MSVISSQLNRSQRDGDILAMTGLVLDVLVIGGGVTGTGAALDAASRGLKVGLVEQRDYASGTSSRSSKLFHGGLRYLEQLNFGLVSEALRERNLMLKTVCPHLARPVSFIYPLKHRLWERPYVGTGVWLYDLMARRSGSPLPRHDHLSKKELEKVAPGIDPKTNRGAVRYWDAMVDDARHTLTVARTAKTHGALLATSVRVINIERLGGISEVTVHDLETGASSLIRSRSVINAAGVWSDDIQSLAKSKGLDVEASKGIHLVVPRDRIQSKTGLILRTAASVLFVIPWDDHWIVGTTDTPWSLDQAQPAASRSDIEYLLTWVNSVLADPLTREDVVGVYAGLRPLLVGESDDTSKLSREHAVLDNGSGLISVAGGKYTTYRVMAKDAVDATTHYLNRPLPPSFTESIPLVGADKFELTRSEPPPAGVSSETHQRLLGRYGSLVTDLYDLMSSDPSLMDPISVDSPYTAAEIVYGVSHEGALHLDDLLTRRARISIETRHRGLDAMSSVAGLVGHQLEWSEKVVDREIGHYRARVEAELDSQEQPDDRTADAARLGAPDVRTGSSE